MNELYHHGVKGMKWGVRKNPTEVARQRVQNEGGSEYSIYYKRFGGTDIRNSSGKKMGYKTRKSLEKSIKSRDIQQYRKLKNFKRLANSGMTYIGNDPMMAMIAISANSASQGSRDNATYQYQKMLIDEGNKYVKQLTS